ncbi:unnamed protein product [Rangifer tarandus platyrhynchus]|uniref:Uncharacterized protein n=1 Tax=Rangifer tarandus platyrhynchus TaxID=3082113 RepID=A0AC59YNJ9_RANTA
MCGALRKPKGTAARVHIGQVVTSIYTKLQNGEHVIEALHRAKFKFPAGQKIHLSKLCRVPLVTSFSAFSEGELAILTMPDALGAEVENSASAPMWNRLLEAEFGPLLTVKTQPAVQWQKRCEDDVGSSSNRMIPVSSGEGELTLSRIVPEYRCLFENT